MKGWKRVATATALIAGIWTGAASAAARPHIVSVAATPQVLSRDGGTVDLRVEVSGARTCTLEGAGASVRTTCRTGIVRARVSVPRNAKRTATTLRFRVTARDAAGHPVTRTITIVQAAGGPPHRPLTITTSSLPWGTVGAAYSTTLEARGGTAPYTWAVASGALPAGLQLTPQGTLAGTPTGAGASGLVLRAKDAAGRTTTTATLPLFVVAAAGALAPQSSSDFRSSNWSGYALLGGPFTAASGTFTVPQIYAGSADASTSEWVGIDGWSSSNSGIIQAGVDESYSPRTNSFDTYAWLELYPAPSVAVPLPVAAGDQVNVAIQQLGADLWSVVMKNLSTGRTWSTSTSWSGPATSAEWIVEAPTSTTLGQLPVAAFSPVTFTELQVNPSVGPLGRLVMVQGGESVSTPSPLTPDGFTVTNGA